MSLFDVNADGSITIDEWCIIQKYSSSTSLYTIVNQAQTQASCPYMKPSDWQDAQNGFNMIDTNANGQIDDFELRNFFSAFNITVKEDELAQAWSMIDPAGRGYFTLNDICEIYNPERYSRAHQLILIAMGTEYCASGKTMSDNGARAFMNSWDSNRDNVVTVHEYLPATGGNLNYA